MARKRDLEARHYREMELKPEWGQPHPSDPNWADGHYHGNRMRGNEQQAAYGLHRLHHQRDLGGSGGFDGRYDEGQGWFDRGGLYHDPHQQEHTLANGGPRGYDRGFQGRRLDYDDYARWEEGFAYEARGEEHDGGVRRDARYLRQYNANSPMLREGRGYDRGFGYAGGAERGPGGWDGTGGPRRERTDERGSNGYNTGGFAEGKFAGPGTRGSIPNR